MARRWLSQRLVARLLARAKQPSPKTGLVCFIWPRLPFFLSVNFLFHLSISSVLRSLNLSLCAFLHSLQLSFFLTGKVLFSFRKFKNKNLKNKGSIGKGYPTSQTPPSPELLKKAHHPGSFLIDNSRRLFRLPADGWSSLIIEGLSVCLSIHR